MYMDLVYIPNHCNAKNVDAEFFKRIRSSYFVVSGNDPTAQEPSKAVLDALLEGKSQWGNNMQVLLFFQLWILSLKLMLHMILVWLFLPL